MNNPRRLPHHQHTHGHTHHRAVSHHDETPDHDVSLPANDSATISHAERARVAKRTTMISVWVNLLISAVQIVVGIFARSQALIADGIHSFSDLVADFVVLAANRESQKAPDTDHPYGHHRFETAASLFLGLILAVVGALMIWAAGTRMIDHSSIPKVSGWAFAVAILTLLCKEGLFRFMLKAGKRVKSSMMIANAWHARSDAASSLVVAFGILGNMMGYPVFDPIAALLVGLMILRMGWKFGSEAFHDLMDRAIDDEELAAIIKTLEATPGVLGIHDIKTRKMGDMILVDAHIEVNRHLTVEQGHDIGVRARQAVMARHRVLNLMTHIDPVDPKNNNS